MLQSLLDALSILRSADESAELHIVLVDNSDSNDLKLRQFSTLQDKLKALNCEFKLMQGHGNIGYGAAHNLVLRKCQSARILLMNPDIELQQDSLSEGMRYLNESSNVSAVSPHAKSPNGTKQYLCKRYPSVLNFILRGFMPGFVRKLFDKRLAKFEMRELSEDHPTTEIPIISGCFMLCCTDALQQVSGFDEDYFLYFEDFDLSLRLGENTSLAYLPSMKIVHSGGNSARKGLNHIRLFIVSGMRFFSTHGWRLI